MQRISKKKKDSRSNLHITEIQLKTHYSAYHFLPNKKQPQGSFGKKSTVCLIHEHESNVGNNNKYRQKSYKNITSSPKNRDEIIKQQQQQNNYNNHRNNNKQRFTSLNNQYTPSSMSYSAKNTTKRIIDYSSNPYIQRNHQNYLSLYTIQEHMKRITSAGSSSSNIDNNNNIDGKDNNHSKSKSKSKGKRNKNLGLIQKTLSSSSKLFQIKQLAYPLQCTSTGNITNGNDKKHDQYNIRQYNRNYNQQQNIQQRIRQHNKKKSYQIDSPHSKLKNISTYWTTSGNNTNTNPNTHASTQSNYNSNSNNNKNIHKRNALNIPNPKRFFSLTKERYYTKNTNQQQQQQTSKINIHTNSSPNTNFYTNTYANYKATKYPIYNNIKNSNLHSFQTNERNYSNTKSNSLNENRHSNHHYSNNSGNSIKKENSQLTPSTISNNNPNSQSKDAIIKSPRATVPNSFVLKSPLIHSSNNSIDSNTLLSKDKIMIKVNRKSGNMSSSSLNSTIKMHTMNNDFIKAYSNNLTQREVEELKGFPYPIYYIQPFEERKRNQIKFPNEINCTFSYSHFPDYNYAVLSRSLSYKKYNAITTQLDANEYNDDEGNYIIVSGDHISYRYEIIDLLGTGSFGEAVRCIDHKTKEIVCVKIIKANPKLYIQANVEIKVLQYIKTNDISNESNIVKFLSHFWFRNHICIVFELLDINLYDHLKMNDYAGFDINQIKAYTTQVLFTLLFLKKHKILHCDLKPENILLLKNDTSKVKVIDFGSSCFETRKIYTYIQSRFYRAPEILLDKGYDSEIDMWSLGCILPELYSGLPIFPGDDEREQMIYIMEYLGVPNEEYINSSHKKIYFFNENNQPYLYYDSDGSIRAPGIKTIESFIEGSPALFQDFIIKCLKWLPKDRITPEDALIHDWIIADMTSEELICHYQKIKRIKMDHTIKQYHYHQQQKNIPKKPIQQHHVDLTTLSSTDRLKREMNHNRSSSKSNITQISKLHPNLKSPIKQIQKRTQSKDITHASYLLSKKFPLSNNRKVSLVIETISNIKRQHESSSKKTPSQHYNSNNIESSCL